MNFKENFIYKDNLHIEGLTNEFSPFYVYNYFKNTNENTLVVTNSLYNANKVFKLLSNLTDKVLLFPMDDFLTSIAVASSPELKLKRLETLEKLEHDNYIVVTNMMGYLKLLPSKKESNKKITLKKDLEIDRATLIDTIETLGYNRDSIVTSTGEYAIRGFIIDIFLIEETHPIRIEFFDNTIESIRYFDEETQRTINEIDEITLKPIDEIVTDNKDTLVSYLNNKYTFIYDKELLDTSYMTLLEEELEYKKTNNTDEKYFFKLEEIPKTNKIYINLINKTNNKENTIRFNLSPILNYKSDFNRLVKEVNEYLTKGKTVLFTLSKDSEIKMIKSLFKDIYEPKNDILELNKINIIKTGSNKGFIGEKLVLISEYDIEEIKENIKYTNNLHIGTKINSIDSIKPGDYVVHRAHGIGIYYGVVTLTTRGIKKDYIEINYAGNDKVYIPVEKISSIYKYSDKEGVKPEVNKLNSTTWARRKEAVKKKIKDISGELIKLYAERQKTLKEPYKDYEEESVFASEFIYEETKDQRRAIEDILMDLNSNHPMDRLLCGDVGFGKTEVAFRAIFKTVLNNKQVLYLCPTTILSKQQYESAKERFKNYPIEIALLNRFTTKKETDRIIEGLSKGTIDIVFGTHKLLSNNISFKKLGLLIVDEEQRFGVTHKEKIKQYKNDVNVLTLSATPIPRTLKMSLSGLRDLSLIDTPPVNRYPVQTYVINENDLIIKDAIYKELGRNGQTFILYNNIEHIEEKMYKLKSLVPEARIRYAHGRMNKQTLDNIMDDFINHEFDILLSTTIIETGIDIPNANTLIIFDADHFGLSQLYQLRGRVGRSNRIAYAYLMYNKNKMLNDIAVKRLQAIRDFTELGSGYKIAMRDLSIRGAGDLLGSEQAGFVDSVGISLYMKMIEEEIKRLKGEKVEDEETDTTSLINVETHIDDKYAEDEEVKIEIHKLINEVDSLSKLNKVKEELEDRFGKITESIEIYMYEEWFEKIAEYLEIKKVSQVNNFIKITIPYNTSMKIKGDKLFLEAYSINPKFQLKYENKEITISLPTINLDKHFMYYVVPLFQKIKEDLQNDIQN